MAASVVQPLCHHRDIGIGRIDLCDDPDQRAKDEALAIRTEKIEWFIGRLHQGNNVRLEGEAGESGAEMLDSAYSWGIDRVLGCIGYIVFLHSEGSLLQGLSQERSCRPHCGLLKQLLHSSQLFLSCQLLWIAQVLKCSSSPKKRTTRHRGLRT